MSEIPERPAPPSFDKAGDVPPAPPPPPPGAGTQSAGTTTTTSTRFTTTGSTSGIPRGLQDLRRSLADRKVAGVCGGLGRASGVDPLIYRVLLVVLTVFAGVGIVAYGVAWLLIPEDGQVDSSGERLVRGRADGSVVVPLVVTLVGLPIVGGFAGKGFGPGFLVVLTILGVALVVGLRGDRPPMQVAGPAPGGPPSAPWTAIPQEAGGSTAYATPMPQAPPVAPAQAASTQPYAPHGPYAGTAAPVAWVPPRAPRAPKERSALGALALSASLVVGGVLWAMDLDMNSKRHAQVVLAAVLLVLDAGLLVGAFIGRARWLILPGLPVMIALIVVSSLPDELRNGVGERNWHPADAQEAQLHSYELGAGQGDLDLSDVHPAAGERIVVHANVGLGELVVTVPPDVALDVTTKQRFGETRLPGGVDVENEDVTKTYAGSASAGTLVLDLNMRIGDLEVRRATS